MRDHDPTGRFHGLRRTVPVRLAETRDLSAMLATGDVVRSAAAAVSHVDPDQTPGRLRSEAGADEFRVEYDGHFSWTVGIGTGPTLSITVPDTVPGERLAARLAVWPRLVAAPIDIPNSCAILRDLVTLGLDSPSRPRRPTEDELASEAALDGSPGSPVADWQAETSYITIVNTTLEPDDLRICVGLVPFERRSPTPCNPIVFALGESGHAASQQVNVNVVGARDGRCTVVISCHLRSSGDDAVDAITAQRAYACVEALCEFIVEWDPDAAPLRAAAPGPT